MQNEFSVDSHYGRFMGAQFDLNDDLKYQDEVVLIVRAKVTEKTYRTTPSGDTREITVLKAEDVTLAGPSAPVSQERDILTFNASSKPAPDLGRPVTAAPVSMEIETLIENSVASEGNTNEVDDKVVVARVGSRDPYLAKFLEELP